MAKKYLNAVKQVDLHTEELALINKDLPIALVHLWEAIVTTWENNRDSPNPYYTFTKSKQTCISNKVSLIFCCRSLRNPGEAAPHT